MKWKFHWNVVTRKYLLKKGIFLILSSYCCQKIWWKKRETVFSYEKQGHTIALAKIEGTRNPDDHMLLYTSLSCFSASFPYGRERRGGGKGRWRDWEKTTFTLFKPQLVWTFVRQLIPVLTDTKAYLLTDLWAHKKPKLKNRVFKRRYECS